MRYWSLNAIPLKNSGADLFDPQAIIFRCIKENFL
jgi:hypothetical protein